MADDSQLEGEKAWYTSKGVISSVAGGLASGALFLSIILEAFGHPVSPADREFIVSQGMLIFGAITAMFTAVAAAISWYGRVFATTKINKTKVLIVPLALALGLGAASCGLMGENQPKTAIGQAAQLDDISGQMVVLYASRAKLMCTQNAIPADKCATIHVAYDKWATAQMAVRDALISWKNSGQAADEASYAASLDNANQAGGDLLKLLAANGVKAEE